VVAEVIKTDETVTTLTLEAVAKTDTHPACCAVVEQTDLSQEQGAEEFQATLAAVGERSGGAPLRLRVSIFIPSPGLCLGWFPLLF